MLLGGGFFWKLEFLERKNVRILQEFFVNENATIQIVLYTGLNFICIPSRGYGVEKFKRTQRL